MIDIVKGKRGLLGARKEGFTMWLADGRQIRLVGEYDPRMTKPWSSSANCSPRE